MRFMCSVPDNSGGLPTPARIEWAAHELVGARSVKRSSCLQLSSSVVHILARALIMACAQVDICTGPWRAPALILEQRLLL